VEADRQILEHLEPYLRETEPDGVAAMLALVARDRVPLDGDELSAAVRRALLVVAAGGDVRRDLTLEEPAVARLAEDIDDLRTQADDLPAAASALDALLADEDRAWRALAAAILADELTDEAD
jgi:hypothetical protein